MKIEEKHLIAIMLKLEGKTYKQIAKHLGLSEITIKTWAMDKDFKAEEEQQKQINIDNARTKLNKNIDKAITTIINATDKKKEYNSIQVKAAELILKFAGMDPINKHDIKVNGEIEMTTLTLEQKKQILLDKIKENKDEN